MIDTYNFFPKSLKYMRKNKNVSAYLHIIPTFFIYMNAFQCFVTKTIVT